MSETNGRVELFPREKRSERLVFKPMFAENVDVFELFELMNSRPCRHIMSHCASTLADGRTEPHETVKETRDHLETVEEQWHNGDNASYIVEDAETGQLIGGVYLACDWDRRAGIPCPFIKEEHWGNGYGLEVAAVMLEVTFDDLNLPYAIAWHRDDGAERSIEIGKDKFIKYSPLDWEAHGPLHNIVVWDGKPVTLYWYTLHEDDWEPELINEIDPTTYREELEQ